MARKATGKIIENVGKDGRTYRALRFTAYGKRRYVTLGPVSASAAEQELRYVLADVERGTWQPQAVEAPPELEPVPTFHEYAEQWWMLHTGKLAKETKGDYRWRLEVHLLPAFGELRLDRISYDTVERYIAAKVAEGKLGPRSINMTTSLLAAILESAVERDLIAKNPAKGEGRRVKQRAPRRSYLETAGQIAALLDAAGALDREATPDQQHLAKRAMMAVMTFAGLRVGELCSLRWRDVDLAGGRLTVQSGKTDAARRKVRIRGALRDELLALRHARGDIDQHGYVFPTRTGQRQYPCKLSGLFLPGIVKRANADLDAAGLAPLPDGLTCHSLRRTFASVLCALGVNPRTAMVEMGHTHAGMTLGVYAQPVDETQEAQLAALVEGGQVEDIDQQQTAVIGRRDIPNRQAA